VALVAQVGEQVPAHSEEKRKEVEAQFGAMEAAAAEGTPTEGGEAVPEVEAQPESEAAPVNDAAASADPVPADENTPAESAERNE
jgi:hypothetical protein